MLLITTYVGLVVNSDHIVYITLKRCEIAASDELRSGNPLPGTLHKVLLCLANGDHVVAATELGLTTAQRLRQEMAQRWTEGAKAFNVTDALQRLCEPQRQGEE